MRFNLGCLFILVALMIFWTLVIWGIQQPVGL